MGARRGGRRAGRRRTSTDGAGDGGRRLLAPGRAAGGPPVGRRAEVLPRTGRRRLRGAQCARASRRLTPPAATARRRLPSLSPPAGTELPRRRPAGRRALASTQPLCRPPPPPGAAAAAAGGAARRAPPLASSAAAAAGASDAPGGAAAAVAPLARRLLEDIDYGALYRGIPAAEIDERLLWGRLQPLLGYMAASPADVARVRQALLLAAAAHAGQARKSGEPFITHPVEVARILAEMRLDSECLIAGLLHDTARAPPPPSSLFEFVLLLGALPPLPRCRCCCSLPVRSTAVQRRRALGGGCLLACEALTRPHLPLSP